jgi:5-methylcytosine-specific restriction endonuclease McrA
MRKNGNMGSGIYKRNTATIIEYEERKRKELESITSEWRYIRCADRQHGKHIVMCANCGKERKVECLNNISKCVCRKPKPAKKERIKVCVMCGAEFIPKRNTKIYCGDSCERKAYRSRHIEAVRERQRTNKRLREARATGNGKVDYSITLSRLIERDNHICQLCGREVNENDYIYVGDVFIAGNDYPSIDHIKPLSKGGLHQWDNVQLAHRLCNSIKSVKE